MAKRLLSQPLGGHLIPSLGLLEAPVLDLMCSHFVLTLATRQGSGLNLRRDFNVIVGLEGRHLVWPVSLLSRLSVKSALGLDDFSFVAEDAEVMCSLLANAVTRQEVGINVLLYGPPGTGKIDLAKVVVQSAGVKLFEVEYADRDGNSSSGRNRYRSLQIAQVFLKGSAQATLLFDEVEDVLPQSATKLRSRWPGPTPRPRRPMAVSAAKPG